ncbi:MAG TPA: Fe-S cluster assembly protein SufD [Alphaproteobacteria bacterium]|nr:Fe-S cluster assembly protein SufD [Alphaproteobacteria bacterium]
MLNLASVIERSRHDREAWKYTPLEKLLAGIDLAPASAGDKHKIAGGVSLPSITPDADERHQLVFINGAWQRDMSQLGELPFDIIAGDATNGYRLTLAGQTCLVTAPVELVFLAADPATPREIAVRLHIELGANGRLTLIEHHATAPGAQVIETEITLGAQAKLVHGKILQGEGAHLAQTHVTVAEGAYYDNFTLIMGGRPARNEIAVDLKGKMAQCALNGLMLLRGVEHADTTTLIRHEAPFGTSREAYKSVVAGKAKGAFQGKIAVASGAQKTDAAQSSKALLLSDQAEMNAKPELEIFADDVKCSHGCAVGDLDTDALFYLRARGIGERDARALLIRAFAEEAIDGIPVKEWRDFCRAQTKEWCDEQN